MHRAAGLVRPEEPPLTIIPFPPAQPDAGAAAERVLPLGATLHARVRPGRIVLSGDIDLVDAQNFQLTVAREARAQGGHLVVDLSEVRFVDSAALGALYALSREADFTFEVIVRTGTFVERVLQISGLARALRVRSITPPRG